MRKQLERLCAISGISGHENAVRDAILTELKHAPAVREVRVDRMGNCIVFLKGKRPAPQTVLFAAHMDEVGGIVTGITDEGYLLFDTVGGITPDVLFAREVWVNGHAGSIGAKAIHQCKEEEKKTVPPLSAMRIDIGADSREEALSVVKEGDAVTFSATAYALHGSTLCTKALDDRAGCALLLKLAQTQPEYDVVLAFTVQEEIGLRGALTAANTVQPAIAVVVDSTTASDTADVPLAKQVTQLGKGPVVSFMDRATLFDTNLYAYIRRLAEQHAIPTQTKHVIAGGNDAGSIQRAGKGATVAAVSLPCRYIHSPSSVLNEQDFMHTYQLLELLLQELPTWETPL